MKGDHYSIWEEKMIESNSMQGLWLFFLSITMLLLRFQKEAMVIYLIFRFIFKVKKETSTGTSRKIFLYSKTISAQTSLQIKVIHLCCSANELLDTKDYHTVSKKYMSTDDTSKFRKVRVEGKKDTSSPALSLDSRWENYWVCSPDPLFPVYPLCQQEIETVSETSQVTSVILYTQ